ncbi:hypothetical protein J3Q64DRAFT_1839904 [Phycomyces blakesleeanus]|uniref:BZIP domain-containing protein n=1 Tax=Phycomyces blakesleeanus TaxID=4837 RepID=A0ABR3ANN1_PHYBL
MTDLVEALLAVKQEPQPSSMGDEDVMTYLNADYLSADPLDHGSPFSDMASSSCDTDLTMNEIKPDELPYNHHAFEEALSLESYPWTAMPEMDPCLPSDFFANLPFLFNNQQPHHNYNQNLNLNHNLNHNHNHTAYPVSPSSSSSDGEQPKKKRGRKKRLAMISPSPHPPPAIAIAPAPAKPSNPVQILPTLRDASPSSSSSSSSSLSSSLLTQSNSIHNKSQSAAATAMATSAATGGGTATGPPTPMPLDAQKAAAQAKRQDRLIKNRAAALLSRKRKREHMNTLEDQNKALEAENEMLRTQVNQLTQRVSQLEKEKELDLRRRPATPSSSPSSSPIQHPKATTGMVFMILLFSFAVFSLPSHSNSLLTVGGSPGGQAPLLALTSTSPSPSSSSISSSGGIISGSGSSGSIINSGSGSGSGGGGDSDTTDLMIVSPVLPTAEDWALQTRSDDHFVDVDWPGPHKHVYFYADTLTRFGPNVPLSQSPVLSLLSPFTSETNDRYLQIDVKVLGSRVVQGQLDALMHCPASATESLLSNSTTLGRRKKDARRRHAARQSSRIVI